MDPKLASALEGLHDIHLPPPVAFWPPAPGWWALAGVLALGGAALAWELRRRRASVRRLALRELAELASRFGEQPDRVALAVSLSTLLRRVALAQRARAEVASLHGEAWIAYLTQVSQRRELSPHVARDLMQTAYRGERSTAGDPAAWLAFAQNWIREVA